MVKKKTGKEDQLESSQKKRSSLSLTGDAALLAAGPVQDEAAPPQVVGGGVQVLQDGVLVVQVS